MAGAPTEENPDNPLKPAARLFKNEERESMKNLGGGREYFEGEEETYTFLKIYGETPVGEAQLHSARQSG